MAQRKKSEVEFIQDTFCPQVAVLCSYDAEVVCRKNSLTFVELVQPFCRYNGEIKISDPSNNLCTITNLRVEIKDINQIQPQPLLIKKLLNDAVSNSFSSSSSQNVIEKHIQTNNYNFTANINTPWFEAWRECFIKVGSPDDHEFLKHYLACIFVVSTSHLDPLDQFQKLILQQQQLTTNPQIGQSILSPKWFFPHIANTYKYFVLLHDVQEGEISKAHQIYENLKSTYGSSNCHLLQINSKVAQSPTVQSSQNEPDPWLQYCKFNDLLNNSLNQFKQPHDNAELIGITNPAFEESTLIKTDNADPLNNNEIIQNPLISFNTSDSNDITNLVNSNMHIINKKHGMCLALSDHDRIKTFISEFLQRGLVPYAERTIRILNEQIQSKKSILKSFSIPRRIFGGSSSSLPSSKQASTVVTVSAAGLTASTANQLNGMGGVTANTASGLVTITNNFIATNDEFQLRRLADLAFMFRLYDVAYNSYHSCKKEFSNYVNSSQTSNNNTSQVDQMLNMNFYLAGALEMASISNFMQIFANHDSSYLSSSSSIPNSTSNSSVASLQSSPAPISSSKIYNTQYMDESIHLFLNICKNVYFATRSTLLSTESLKANNLFLRAANQFVNLSNDDTDIRSALFLEQAAQCYLAQYQPWIRKYAFFLSLAGHRFNKAGQKKHALRVYKHALEIYENKGWYKAQDHINFVLSRLNFNLKNTQESLEHIQNIILKILQTPTSHHRKKTDGSSSVNQQPNIHFQNPNKHHHKYLYLEFSNEANILRDFILYSDSLIKQTESNQHLPILVLPIIDYSQIRVNLEQINVPMSKEGNILVANRNISNTSKINSSLKEMWLKFEEELYMNAFKTSVPIMFKPQTHFFNKYTDNKQMPKVVVDECISISFELKNHLRINLNLSDIKLLWKFVDQQIAQSNEHSNDNATSLEMTNEKDDPAADEIAECSLIKEVVLNSHETNTITLTITPKRSHGHLHILGISYRLATTDSSIISLHGKHLFEIRGSRLNNNQQNMRSIVYDTDNRLNFKVVNKTALLQIEMDHVPKSIMCNQFERVRFFFKNKSIQNPIGNLRIASNAITMSSLCFSKLTHQNQSFKLNECSFSKDDFKSNDHSDLNESSTKSYDFKESIYYLENVVIQPNECYELDMWILAPENEGEHTFYFMFFYQDLSIDNSQEARPPKRNSFSANNLKYRLARFEFTFKTSNTLTTINKNVVDSQTSNNLLLNLEVSNQDFYTTFQFVDCISVSDIWTVNPIKNGNNFYLKPLSLSTLSSLPYNSSTSSMESLLTLKFSKNDQANKNKRDEIISMVLKAKPIVTDENQANKIHFFKSKLLSDEEENVILEEKLSELSIESESRTKPDDSVLAYFIKTDLRKYLESITSRDYFLNLVLLWKSTNNSVVRYGLSKIKMLSNHNLNFESYFQANKNNLKQPSSGSTNSNHIFQSRQQQQKEIEFNKKQTMDLNLLDLTRYSKNLIIISSSCLPCIKNDFDVKSICSMTYNIKLQNLSTSLNFDLLVIARNPRNPEINKTYLWVGCNKKFVNLKSKQTKFVKLKLVFISHGVYEVGKLQNDVILKMNLLDATNQIATSTATTSLQAPTATSTATTSLDEYINDDTSFLLNLNSDSNSIKSQSQYESGGPNITAISIYLKNNLNNRYELFKMLNPFTICVTR